MAALRADSGVSEQLVRICPVCELENAPDMARCSCGASLLLVDFSVKREAATVTTLTNEFVRTTPRTTVPAAGEETQLSAQPGTHEVQCPYADCAQPNPTGLDRCFYCNRPLHLDGYVGDPLAQAAVTQSRLPSALRARYSEIAMLPTVGAEADLVLVALRCDAGSVASPAHQRIVKLYRLGIQGDDAMLAKVAHAGSAHIVHIYEHGVADGVRFEVMEYCPLGSLRDLLQQGPMSVDRVHALVAELAQGLVQVQALHILHRDLKPENILVRALEPLALVLTDFGIASLRMATQHFTGGARTTRYAAPEALTGVLDDKADWWSLGMVVLEAVVGRHPFDGLSEQVANYQLATKPIDTRVVFHDRLRVLCRGLLLRDPKRRWGAEEVQRWLADDPTLTAPEEGAASVAVRPYQVADVQCTTAVELAATLAKNWHIGCKDLMRGSVTAWVENELHNYNLLRKLQDIQDMRGVSPDWRLLSFMLAAAPDIPAVWQERSITRESLLIAARKASGGDAKAATWLQSLHSEGIMELLVAAGREEVSTFRAQWLAGLQRFADLWNRARAAEDYWVREPKAWHGQQGVVVDVDYALYLQPIRMALPKLERQHGPVLLAMNFPAYVSIVRAELVQALAGHDPICPWLLSIGEVPDLDAVGVMVTQQLLPLALEDMVREAKHMVSAGPAVPMDQASASESVLQEVRAALELARLGTASDAQVGVLHTALEPAQEACLRVIRMSTTAAKDTSFRNAVESLSRAGIDLQAALNAALEVRKINAIWLEPQRLGIASAACLMLGTLLTTGWLVTGLLLLGGGIAWRLHLRRAAQAQVDSRIKTFIRFGDKVLGKKPR